MHFRTLVLALILGTYSGSSASAQQREPEMPVPEALVGRQVTGFVDPDPAEKLTAEQATCGRPRLIEAKPIDASAREEMRGAGKMEWVDPSTGEAIFQHLTDFLPDGWGKRGETSKPTDSFGNPIVNHVSGLPGWAEQDIQALRTAIEESLAALRDKTVPRNEGEQVLGNYLGQALVRGLDVSDLVRLDSEVVSPGVGRAILAQLSFYENLKLDRAETWGYDYQPSVYGEQVEALIEAQGSTLAEILSTTASAQKVPVKAAPSGCYAKTTFTRGMFLLTGSTVIWNVSGQDDASADVPTGFSFNFYGCSDPDPNLNVRVSTNGYLTFFEQGGGALDGTDFGNDPITSVTDPDGYVAPFWDDLWVAPSQGSPDKVSYLTEGAVGSRVFTVEWYSVSRLGGETTDYHYFQAKLIEATGDVELHFDTLWANDSFESATVGMEDFAGLDGDCGPDCSNTNTGDTIPSNYRFAPLRPTNNNCGLPSAACLASDGAATGTNLGATGTDLTSCGFNDIHDVWFWYHAPVTGNVTFDACSGTTFDTTLAVFDQCSGGTQLGCSDDFCDLQSQITVALTSGQDYYVRLGGFNGSQGTYQVAATPASLANGDTCADAWAIAEGFLGFSSNNSGCVDQTVCAFDDVVDEWFSWMAPYTGQARVTTCNPNTDFDTTLAVFDSCGGAQLACNDDDLDAADVCSTVEWPVTAGTTYKIRIAGFGRAYGNYDLTAAVPTIFSDGFESGDLTAWTGSFPNL